MIAFSDLSVIHGYSFYEFPPDMRSRSIFIFTDTVIVFYHRVYGALLCCNEVRSVVNHIMHLRF